jgi:hypothetical protein
MSGSLPKRRCAQMQPGQRFGIHFARRSSGCNRGSIERARINVGQTRSQIAALEHQISEEVERAYLDCELSLGELLRMERGILVDEAKRFDAAERAYLAESAPGAPRGTSTIDVLMRKHGEYEREERRYVSILARYLGSTLDLNTAVGKSIMP